MGWTLLKSHQREFLRDYVQALLNTPQIFRRLAFRRRTLEEELQEALLRGSLRKAFNGFDLLMLGLGIVIGSGWAQLTGTAAQQYSGAAIFISYLFAGLAALLASACYSELCAEFPVSGGSFSYIMVTFGEFAAFVALAGLLLEYALGMAAVARGFSANFAALINLQPKDVRLWVDKAADGHSFDLLAAGVVLFMSMLLSIGVRESAHVISGMTVIKLLMLLAVAIVGYCYADWDNPSGWPYSHWSPFLAPAWDVDGLFVGASVCFFAYTGFDAIGNAAEEVQNVRHLPPAIVGTVLISMLTYLLLSLSLVLLVYPNIACPACNIVGSSIPPLVNFISAFNNGHGLKSMQYVVSLTALFGIVTALTVGLFSVSRIVMAASRDWLLPPFLARISKRTQTPLVAQMVLGVIIALLAFMVEVDAATSMVSFGTLIALWLVCNAQMWRRYFPELQLRFTSYGTVETVDKQELASHAVGRGWSVKTRRTLVWVHMLGINVVCIALAVFYMETTSAPDIPDLYCEPAPAAPAAPGGPPAPPPAPPPPPPWLEACSVSEFNLRHSGSPAWFAIPWFVLTLSLHLTCPLAYQPEGWHIPRWLMPWLPSTAIALLCFSVGALPNSTFWRTGLYFLVLLFVYLLFSLPMSYIKHSKVDRAASQDVNVVELTYVDGQWQPSRLDPLYASYLGSPHSSGMSREMALKPGYTGSGSVAGAKLANGSGALHPAGSAAIGSRPNSTTAAGTGPGRPGGSTRPGGRGRSSGRLSSGGRAAGRGPGGGALGAGGAGGALPQPAPTTARPTLPPTLEDHEGV
ncbi:hypothetical protein ABPG77_008654 [Micractinium sp. CCAP 211/92]